MAPAGDLVVIGLPARNAVSQLVVDHLNEYYRDLNFVIDESSADFARLTLGTFDEKFNVRLQADSKVPERDLALIALWVNPLTPRKRRLMWCAGFTAYGTAAAADYLVNHILTDRLSGLRRGNKGLPSLWSKRWVCFLMVIEVKLLNDQVGEIRERAFVPLPDPGCPPLSVALGSDSGIAKTTAGGAAEVTTTMLPRGDDELSPQ